MFIIEWASDSLCLLSKFLDSICGVALMKSTYVFVWLVWVVCGKPELLIASVTRFFSMLWICPLRVSLLRVIST